MATLAKAVYQTEDGQIFATKEQAEQHVRLPLLTAALNELTGKNADLVAWCIAKEDEIRNVFSRDSIRRVTRRERELLGEALDAIKASAAKEFKFVIDNSEAIATSFRWPTVKRMNEAEAEVASRVAANELTGNNKDLVDWILSKKDELLTALDAGKVKREASEKAMTALKAYQAKAEEQKAKALGMTVEKFRAHKAALAEKEAEEKAKRAAARAAIEAAAKK